jgi:hypothetical protein
MNWWIQLYLAWPYFSWLILPPPKKKNLYVPEPVTITLFRKRIRILRWDQPGLSTWVLNLMTSVLIKGIRRRQTQGRGLVTTEAKTREMQPQPRPTWSQEKSKRGRKEGWSVAQVEHTCLVSWRPWVQTPILPHTSPPKKDRKEPPLEPPPQQHFWPPRQWKNTFLLFWAFTFVMIHSDRYRKWKWIHLPNL